MKNELCMCNISMKGNISPTRHGGIQRIRLHNLINHNTNLSGPWLITVDNSFQFSENKTLYNYLCNISINILILL